MPTTAARIRDRAVELGIYLPLGAYSRAREELSDIDFDRRRLRSLFDDLVERGEKRLEPIEKRIRRGASRTETRVRRQARETRREIGRTTRGATSVAKRTVGRAAAGSTGPKLPRVATPTTPGKLAIKGYGSLTADEIVSQLRGLTVTELARVYKFERANENRTTILEAIEAKLVDLPIATYDSLTVDEIDARLAPLSQSELKKLRRYEADTKGRTTVIEKLDALIS